MEEENGSKSHLFTGIGVALLGAIAAIFMYTAQASPGPAVAVAEYVPYEVPDKAFACVAPKGWEQQEASAHAIRSTALFKDGHAKIDITADLSGSLMGDIMTAQNNQMSGMMPEGVNAPKPKPAVERLHAENKGIVKKKVSEYKEGPMQPFNSRLGEARVSEWTGNAGLMGGGALHGYRISILSGERLVTVICQAPEKDWKTLKPTFLKVIGSLTPGGG